MRFHPPRPPRARRMGGVLNVRTMRSPDGDKQIATFLPHGHAFTLSPEETLQYAFALLVSARNAFASQETLDSAVVAAQASCKDLLPDQRRPQ